MMIFSKTSALSIMGLAAVLGVPAYGDASNAWQFEVTPYLLAAGMDGTVGVQDFTTDVDASFSDILDNLDAGFMGIFTARKGPWLMGFEGVYMKLAADGSNTVTGPGGNVSRDGKLDVTSKMSIYQGSLGYRVFEEKTTVDLFGALRYTKLDVDLEIERQFTPGVIFPGGSASASGSDSWTDAVVGVMAEHPVSPSVSLVGYADVGGGGSDLTYQFIGGVNWVFAQDFAAKLGYRYLSWDYEDDGTVWDMAAHGPYLGLGIRF